MNLENYRDKKWRLNNLYRIIDKDGNSIKFKLNEAQEAVFDGIHSRTLILKARQLGLSTGCVLYILDDTIFEPTLSGGIVSYSLEHAQHIFKKIIGHAIDNLVLPPGYNLNIKTRSAREIVFGNGSTIRVDTSLRGGSYQRILVSEFGKTCARSPLKAEEIITGTLNAIPANGIAIIESTGEGNEGFFAEMCQNASIRGNDNLSPLEYKLFFFPWHIEPTYMLDKKIPYPVELTDYFNSLEENEKIKISQQQRYWYASQVGLLGDKVKQEFPSTVSEAFLSSSDAYYFAQCIEKAYQDNRCVTHGIYDALQPVYVSMDIGVNDLTVIIFFQVIHGEIRIIDYYEDKNKGLDFYSRYLLQDKKYLYHSIFLPHDSKKRDPLDTSNSYERDMKKYFAHTDTRIIVLPRARDKNLSISHSKIKFDRCVFNITKVKPLLDHLSKYRKKWSEATGRYLDEPYHDIHSNYADAFIYLAEAVTHIESVSSMKGSLEKHRKVVDSRYRKVI